MFDANPALFAVSNGVIDLKSGNFREGEPGDYLSRQATATYDPAAACPRFMEFLNFITCGDREYAAYLQRALGYTLFGHAGEQVLFIVIGRSGNGKGTLFRLIAKVLGPYVTAVAPNLLSKAYSGKSQQPDTRPDGVARCANAAVRGRGGAQSLPTPRSLSS